MSSETYEQARDGDAVRRRLAVREDDERGTALQNKNTVSLIATDGDVYIL